MAYLKTHYPAEFMTARLSVWGGFYRPNVYMSESRRLGLSVMPPHINHSNMDYALERPKTLWMGLAQVRDLTHVTIQSIIAQRPFDSLQDFLIRARPQYGEAVNLVQAGALEGLGNPSILLAQIERDRWRGRHTGQLGLLSPLATTPLPEPDIVTRATWQREILGDWVSIHPLQLVAEALAQHTPIQSNELDQHISEEVTVAGIRVATHRFASKQDSMWLADMEDEYGMYQVLWSGAALSRYRPILTQREPVLIRGRVRQDRQGLVILAGDEIKQLRQTMVAE